MGPPLLLWLVAVYLPSRLAEALLNIGHHDADGGNGGFELVGSAVEALGPVAQFVGFVDVDAGAVGGATVLEVIGHSWGWCLK